MISVNSTDMLSIVSLFIALLSLVVTIRSLKLTEEAFKVADNSLMLSMYLQKRKDAIDSLNYFYYPLYNYLSDFFHHKKVKNTNLYKKQTATYRVEKVDNDESRFYIAYEHVYLGDPEFLRLVWECVNSFDDEKLWELPEEIRTKITSVMDRLDSVIVQKQEEIAALTKEIEKIGGKSLL